MSTAIPALEARNLNIGYGKSVICSGIDLSVMPGEVVCIAGSNGCGKTTLLRTLAGFLPPVGGSVLIKGMPLGEMSRDKLAKLRAVLFTGSVVSPLMTAYDVASAGRYPYTDRMGRLTDEDETKVEKALEEMNAASLSDSLFSRLSDGQKQRVLLARALCQEPEILLLDEPATYLDIKYRLEMVRAVRKMAAQYSMAVIVSLHELDLIRRLSDRIVCLRDGKVDRVLDRVQDFDDEYVEYLFDITDRIEE